MLLRATTDLNTVVGTLPATGDVATLVFSFDGRFAARYLRLAHRIEVIDLSTFRLAQTMQLPSDVYSDDTRPVLAFDTPASHVFFSDRRSSGVSTVDVYSIRSVETPPPHSVLNVSTRLRTQTGDNVLIGGFIITGDQPKKIIARAIGPSLPVAGALANPVLQLYNSSGVLIEQNDNWNAHRAEVLETDLAPINQHESAIVTVLSPGAYTTILSGFANSSGVALVEIYDLAPSTSHIANISTRGKVETGDNVLIGGFIVGGDQSTRMIVRAIGPSLAGAGVNGALADTTLALYDANGAQFAANDDWPSDQAGEIIASGLAPTDSREAAIIRTLTPGSYTAIVRGKNDTTGVALVEVYNLDAN